MTVKPKHYEKFKCIASECPDTCCAGWEIDVDEDTADFYSNISGADGEFVRDKLIDTAEGHKLCLEGERCRFLRDDNLCELIMRFGEDALCDICREHPRFYTEYGNLMAAGMGLCCPEAARLWLSEPCEFILTEDGYDLTPEEREAANDMLELIESVAFGGGTLGERLASIIGDDGENDGLYSELCELYSSAEVLDKGFPGRFSSSPLATSDKRCINLAAYFIFRYYLEIGREMTIKFTAASLIMIAAMGGELDISAKDYSKEIEYDTDNLDMIYGFLSGCRGLGALCRTVLSV